MKPFDLVFKILGAVYDPARGAISITRSTAVTFLTLASLQAGEAKTTPEVVQTGVYAAAAVAALAFRGRKDPPVPPR